jgi:hypothetical protein
MVIRWLYTIFLSVLLVTFVGVGIAAFYKSPKFPEYPAALKYPETQPITSQSAQTIQQQKDFDKKQTDFTEKNERYNKNVSTIAIVASLLILVLSISLLSKILYLSDGLLLGGVLTLGYAIIRGFGTGDEIFRFFVVSIGLIVAIFLGYWKFVRTIKNTSSRK